MSTYREPRWGSKIVSEAIVSKDRDGHLYLNDVRVVTVHAHDLFSELACIDGTRHIVLTAFLRLVKYGETFSNA